jgi:2-keto-4-pentenoate hydratase/2-oxohepta-3-ene-1,7-dioic acid hydratase in catechol pathway
LKKVKIQNSNKEFSVGKIVCVGRNYAEHAKELGNEIPAKPVLFLKPPSAIIYSGDNIVYPDFSNEMHHEVELVLLIGEKISKANLQEAESVIIGYGVGLDMTLRDLQSEAKKKGHPWTISKCFDTSAVVSDFVLKENYTLILDEEVSLSVNGVIKQKDRLNKMIFSPAQIVEYISSLMILEEGDLIFTGTPKGVGKVNRGDKLIAQLSDILSLICTVT